MKKLISKMHVIITVSHISNFLYFELLIAMFHCAIKSNGLICKCGETPESLSDISQQLFNEQNQRYKQIIHIYLFDFDWSVSFIIHVGESSFG